MLVCVCDNARVGMSCADVVCGLYFNGRFWWYRMAGAKGAEWRWRWRWMERWSTYHLECAAVAFSSMSNFLKERLVMIKEWVKSAKAAEPSNCANLVRGSSSGLAEPRDRPERSELRDGDASR